MPLPFRRLRIPAALAVLCLMLPGPVLAKDDVVLRAMKDELQRSFSKLKKAEKEPMYYLGYEIHEDEGLSMSALLGAIRNDSTFDNRSLSVDVRFGNRKLDSTHQLKGSGGQWEWPETHSSAVTSEDDEPSIRADIWLHTDQAYKSALQRYIKVKTNKAVTAEEEDKSDDFSQEKPQKSYEKLAPLPVDREAWRRELRRLSEAFKKYPFIIDSNVSFHVKTVNRYIVNSEGTEIVTGNRYVTLNYSIEGRTEDGMDLGRYQRYDAARPEDLPDVESVLKDMERSAGELEALLKGPLAEPYHGPAIFRARAAGVYFHEILGHRLEGHRQKLEEEGQTFAKMLGKPVTADFISVYDDASMKESDGRFLRGFYQYDDEGVKSRNVTLVENGILKGFLMSRSPIKAFKHSNGHGRRSEGRQVVSRMGNTLVKASKTVPYEELRKGLVAEIKKQGKPYGLIFDDIAGGFTTTGRHGPQSFKVIPKLVWRVFPDGRPDEAVRGVDIVGTPLTSFTKIIAAADDYDIFNGTCGAESGWVPVSAVAPSLLLSEIEVEKKFKASKKPPILPPPHHDKGGKR